jgi:hypothetical protein
MTYGPGDPQTWPGHTGHANDPCNDDDICPGCDDPCDATCGWEPTEPDWEEMLR